MSKTTTAILAGVLAAAAFALGHWTASPSRPPQRVAEPGAPLAPGPEAARRAIAEELRTPGSIDSMQRLADLLEKLGDDAIPAIPPTILHPGESIDPPRAVVLLQYWIDRDAKAAGEWIAGNAPLAYRNIALIPAIERIAENNPADAVNLVGRARGADPRTIKPFVRGWVKSGRPGVDEWIRNLDYGFKRQKALGAFWRAKIEKEGTAAAIAWFEALPDTDDGFRQEAFQRLTSELTYADPKVGTEWYEKHREGPEGKGLMMAVIDAWVGVDGPAAMRWISQQPPSEERDNAVLDGIRWWGMADVQGLKYWGRKMGSDGLAAAWFQPGLPIFAKLYGNEDPREGIQWAEHIAHEPTRLLTLSQIARDWHQSDPAAAEAWISQSPLSEEEKARARTPWGPGPQPKPQPAPPPADAPGA